MPSVWYGLHNPPHFATTAVTIGMFDGVHRAHQQLLQATVACAERYGLTPVAVTFDPDPHAFFHPDHSNLRLMPTAERCRQILGLGLRAVWVIPFERSVARISAEAFVRRVLVGQLHAKACIIGHDFGFGRGRRGNLALLKRLGKALGMGVEAIGAYSYRGTVVSSSVIRRCIQAGAMRKAEQLLGRPYVLYGRVVRGDGRGARMGYPTANVQLQEQVLPPQGVYTVRLHVRGQGFDGVMNLGQRPTFNAGFACEVHCFDKDLQLYRRQVQVEVFRRLRGEKRFASARALVAQIRHDIRRARLLLQ